MFKQLKKRLLLEKKVKNYIIYAIGEIILIVVGILVAMNINNWNDTRKNISKSKYFIEEVSIDLKRDTAYFNFALDRIDVKIAYKRKLLSKDSISNYSTGDIQQIISSGSNNIKINTGAFDKMKESGVLSLQGNKYLFQKLNIYYTSFKDYLDIRNDWEKKFVENEYDYWFYQNKFELEFLDTLTIENSQENRLNTINEIQSNQGKNVIKMAIFREESMKETYKKTISKAENLLHIIDSLQLQKKD